MTTKLHAVVNGFGNPLHLQLSAGNINDISLAESLLEPFDLAGTTVIADKGYDSRKLVAYIEQRGGMVVIPSRSLNKEPRIINWALYKRRHLVENFFLKLKSHRAFATRYDKTASSFLALSFFAASLIWLSC